MNTKKQGFLQAAGVSIYATCIGLFMASGSKFLPKQDSVFSSAIFLILFSASVLICALIVFYKPYLLFFAGKKKAAIETVMYTAVSLFVFALLGFIGLVIFR